MTEMANTLRSFFSRLGGREKKQDGIFQSVPRETGLAAFAGRVLNRILQTTAGREIIGPRPACSI
jgi:hypothetical protein